MDVWYFVLTACRLHSFFFKLPTPAFFFQYSALFYNESVFFFGFSMYWLIMEILLFKGMSLNLPCSTKLRRTINPYTCTTGQAILPLSRLVAFNPFETFVIPRDVVHARVWENDSLEHNNKYIGTFYFIDFRGVLQLNYFFSDFQHFGHWSRFCEDIKILVNIFSKVSIW